MNTGAYATIREHLQNVFAQGLQIVAPAEMSALAQKASALNLSQPAALLTQMQQQAVTGSVAKKDAETLVKVMQLLAQTEIQLSGLGTVDLDRLTEAQHGVYVPTSDMLSGEQRPLETILTIPNPFVRGHELSAYLAQASDDELTRSVELLWCDFTCVAAIAEGLRARPEQVLRLAQQALAQNNGVIRYTALRVLAALQDTPQAQAAGDLLANAAQKAKPPLTYRIAETQARLAGRMPDYQQERQRRVATYQEVAATVHSPHKNVRKAGIRAVGGTNDPCFVDIIVRQLSQETERKNIKALCDCLADIGGFEAIPVMNTLLDGPFTQEAVDALSRLGDRSALMYIMLHLADKKLPEYASKALRRYDELALYPFIFAIKQLKKPNAYKRLFTTLWPIIGSKAVQQRLIAEAERDADLAQHPIMAYIAPEQAQTGDEKALQKAADKTDRKAQIVALATSERIRQYGAAGMFPTPDGKQVVMLFRQIQKGSFHVVRTTDWASEVEIPLSGHSRLINMTPDGEFVLVARAEMVGHVWEYRVDVWKFGQWDQPIGTVPFPTEPSALAMTADHRALVIGGVKLVQVVTVDTWQTIATLLGHGEASHQRVSYAACIPHTTQLVTGDWTGKLNVWDTTDWHLVASLKADSWMPGRAALSADSKFLVYGGHIGIKIWETATWKEIVTMKKPMMTCVAISPDGRFLLTGKDKKLRILDFAALKPVVALDDDDIITSITITPDGQHILTCGARKGLKVWNLDLSAL